MMRLRHIGQLEAYLEEEHAGKRHTITAILPREEVEELYRRLVGWDALANKLHAIAEIATWEERDKDAYIAQGPGLLIRDMRRILTIARGQP